MGLGSGTPAGLLSFSLHPLASSVPREGVDQGPLRRQIPVIPNWTAYWLSPQTQSLHNAPYRLPLPGRQVIN